MPGSESKKRVPYSRKPRDISLDQWQAGLRKQFASEQNFKIIEARRVRIKNWETLAAKSVMKILSGYTIVTTRTTLENRIDELHKHQMSSRSGSDKKLKRWFSRVWGLLSGKWE